MSEQINPKNNLTLTKILDAAKKEFAAIGFHDAQIRKIAREAKISPSTIYEYYGSKEELLLAIPETKVRELININREHLYGIDSSLEKLKKVTWITLRFYESDPDLACVIYTVVIPHKTWYGSPSYHMIREWGDFITNIFTEGQQKGEIRNDIDTFFMRQLYLGGIARLIMLWLLYKRQPLVSMAPSFNDLIVSSVRKPSPTFVVQPLPYQLLTEEKEGNSH